jgi:hypothetical protein
MFVTLLRVITVILILSLHAYPQATQPTPSPNAAEINTALMETTFLLSGPSAIAGEETQMRQGTCFIMIRAAKPDSTTGVYVLITAKHVLDDIKGEEVTVFLRKRNRDGDAILFPYAVKIRDKTKNLYTVHPLADVAAIDVAVPYESTVFQLGENITSVNWLATDQFLRDINLHPGDILSCLGYPFGLAANNAGYPILRSGQIASYPFIPLKKAGTILYNLQVQPGNSGGPVYFSYTGRPFKNKFSYTTLVTYQKLFGLVIQKITAINSIDPAIGIIIPSIFIKETIDLLAGFTYTIKEDQ